MSKLLSLLILILINTICLADNIINVNSVRIWPSPESTRIVFDLSNQANYKIQTFTNPDRIVVDFNNAKLNKKLAIDLNKAPKLARIKQMRTSEQQNIARVIFELEEKYTINSFTLKPNERYGHRLILDLDSNEKEEILALFDLDKNLDKLDKLEKNKIKEINSKPMLQQQPKSNLTPNNIIISPKPVMPKLLVEKELLIAIDAGHGGEDPGAVGPYGTQEKVVVLEIAKTLAETINNKKNMKAFLIRSGDYYIGLRDRSLRARKRNADLFISIHADAFTNKTADGASVFILSERGASSAAAKWLADSENRSDTLGGVRIDRREAVLSSVLLDLSQTANGIASYEAAKNILSSMQKTVPLHKSYVERAGFAILKAPDVPSVLVEAGFISNPRTEMKLKNKGYQGKIVDSIMGGIEQYFLTKPKKHSK